MQRVLFVDVLRLLALLQMINGHTLDAVLTETARSGEGFQYYTFVRGLVSVAFLVVAGISFHLTTLARWHQHRSDAKAVRRRLTRAFQIVAVGYLLQMRLPSVYFDPMQRQAAFQALFRCEVLQCIGLSLMALELTTLLARTAGQVVFVCGTGALALFVLSPHAQRASELSEPSLWSALIGHAHGSQFPLLPWAGYVLSGVVLSWFCLPASGRTPVRRRVGGLLAAATVSSALSSAASLLPAPQVLASSATWFVLQKLTFITMVLALLAVATHKLGRLPILLTILGGETLAIFVFHLQVIYGTHWSLGRVYARSLPLSQALLASLLNVLLSAAFAFAWRALKQRVQRLRVASASPIGDIEKGHAGIVSFSSE